MINQSAAIVASALTWKQAHVTLDDAVKGLPAALGRFTIAHAATLERKIPRGTGQTYPRTVLVAVDHASYHVAQVVAVRRLLGAWG